MRLIVIVALALVELFNPFAAEAQQADKIARIGYLSLNVGVGDAGYGFREAFRQGLRDLGYVESAELVALKVDVIVASGGIRGALAAKQATTTLPIVFPAVGDPVAEALVDSLARPGGTSRACLAAKHRLPTVYSFPHYVEAGGLMSYGPDIPDSFRRAATYVDKILKGAKPADLPVEQPTKFQLIVNRKTARGI